MTIGITNSMGSMAYTVVLISNGAVYLLFILNETEKKTTPDIFTSIFYR